MTVGNESSDSNKDDMVDLDRILVEEIGEGRYQAKAIALCGLLTFLMGLTYNDFIFFSERVKTRCKIEECEDQDVGSLSPSWIADAVPVFGQTFDSCHRFDLSNSWNSSVIGCHPSLFNKSSVVECTEYVYQHQNTAVYEFGLACDEWRWFLFGSSVVVGMMIKQPLTGFISDRWGRRLAVSFAAFNFVWINVTRYWVNSFNIFILITLLASACGSSTMSCSYLLDKMTDKVRVQELDPSTLERLTSLFPGQPRCARFGDGGYIMPIGYTEGADNFKNMVIRPDDTWVVTFPRSGTTWTQELVWLLMNDLDYETASTIPLMERYMFIELWFLALTDSALPEEAMKYLKTYEDVVNAPSPRFIKTHLPLSLLPISLLDTTKVVYVARDPRDVAVSYHDHNKHFDNYCGDFKTYWNLFMNHLVTWSPFFSHLKEAWAHRHHPNLLFIFYEDLIKDLPSSIKRIATFLGKEITNEQTMKLSNHLNIKNFRKNRSVNPDWINQIGNSDHGGFVRKGKSGGWREHFDEEMTALAEKWMRENLADTDLRFPDASS